jgi:hypothetical protein
LITDSVDKDEYLLIIRGIIINKFNSSPSHLVNQEEDEIATNEPVISSSKNINS